MHSQKDFIILYFFVLVLEIQAEFYKPEYNSVYDANKELNRDFNDQYISNINFEEDFINKEAAARVFPHTGDISKVKENIKFANQKNVQKAPKAIHPPLRIGSFNIQTLGKKKFERPSVMNIVQKVILRYDLILVMEIIASEDVYLKRLLLQINNLSPDGPVYNMTLSQMHPDTKERCAFFYRTDKLRVMESYSYQQPEDGLYRKPLVVLFSSQTLRDMNRFLVVGLHIKPSQAVQEMNALANVYDFITKKHKTEDVLLMGDFNADCDYVKEKNWENITLWTRKEFTWPIGNNIDTTTNHKSCALDRFVFAGSKMNDGIVPSSAKVFDFRDEYELTTPQMREVSDHFPIEIKIRGKMSDAAETHLSTKVCFTVDDSRPVTLSAKTIKSKAASTGYKSRSDQNTTVLTKEIGYQDALLDSLQTLKKSIPDMITDEQLEATMYKINHGSLEDFSSLVNLPDLKFQVTIEHQNRTVSITVCKTTTVN